MSKFTCEDFVPGPATPASKYDARASNQWYCFFKLLQSWCYTDQRFLHRPIQHFNNFGQAWCFLSCKSSCIPACKVLVMPNPAGFFGSQWRRFQIPPRLLGEFHHPAAVAFLFDLTAPCVRNVAFVKGCTVRRSKKFILLRWLRADCSRLLRFT